MKKPNYPTIRRNRIRVHGNDWCHVCGERDGSGTVDIHYPENAEHEPEAVRGPRSTYIRICERCAMFALHQIWNKTPSSIK